MGSTLTKGIQKATSKDLVWPLVVSNVSITILKLYISIKEKKYDSRYKLLGVKILRGKNKKKIQEVLEKPFILNLNIGIHIYIYICFIALPT